MMPRVPTRAVATRAQIVNQEKPMESSGSQLGPFVKAVAFAAEKHRNQRRKDADASPYINHPIALANVLAGPPKAGMTAPQGTCSALP
jgi:(p)ppGpp synthase/HD superfamily hydrolase